MKSSANILFRCIILLLVTSLLIFLDFLIDIPNIKIIMHDNTILDALFFLIAILIIVFICYNYLAFRISESLRDFIGYIKSLRLNELRAIRFPKFVIKSNLVNEIYFEYNKLLELYKGEIKLRVEAEKKLNSIEENPIMLAECLPQGIFETDRNGKLTYVNKKFLEIFGYNKEEIQTKNLSISDILIFDSIEVIYNETTFFEAEMIGICKNNSAIPVSVYTSNINQYNKISGLRGIVIDDNSRIKYINELREDNRKLKEMNDLKTKTLVDMTYNIRPLVNAILGFSNLSLIPGKSNKIKKEYTCQIISNGEKLLRSVDNIIDMVKIETGEILINKCEFDLNVLLTDVYSYFLQLRNMKNKKNIELRLQHDFNNKPFFINTDPIRLRQILNNLIENALLYTRAGYIEFGFSNFGTLIHFYVKDTGPGISEDIQNTIFDPCRISGFDKNLILESKGLGLFITKNLVELLGGRIWMSSDIGIGSTFYFTVQNEKGGIDEFINNKVLDIEVGIN